MSTVVLRAPCLLSYHKDTTSKSSHGSWSDAFEPHLHCLRLCHWYIASRPQANLDQLFIHAKSLVIVTFNRSQAGVPWLFARRLARYISVTPSLSSTASICLRSPNTKLVIAECSAILPRSMRSVCGVEEDNQFVNLTVIIFQPVASRVSELLYAKCADEAQKGEPGDEISMKITLSFSGLQRCDARTPK